ncbi:hypothetical protein C8Q75DRAFT_892433 [Abortiporus biennis]|nr:hypothetical protein C8Q75DRAFT_892433 [Abortiporus biennis]
MISNICKGTVMFQDLPPDILFHILRFLHVRDLLSFRKTSKLFANLTAERCVWFDAFNLSVYSKGLPIPGLHNLNISSMNSKELENLTLKSLRLHHNWASRYPKSYGEFNIPSEHVNDNPRVLSIYFLVLNGRQYLLTVIFLKPSLDTRNFALGCWDISSSTPRCVARRYTPMFAGMMVNKDSKNPAIISLTKRGIDGFDSTAILSIDLDAQNPDDGFTTLSEFPTFGKPLLLQGSTFLSSNERQFIGVYDINLGALQCILQVPLPHGDLTTIEDGHRCHGVVVIDRFVVSFCRQWINLYVLPFIQDSSNSLTQLKTDNHDTSIPPEVPRIDPIAQHRWQWRIDHLLVSPQIESRSQKHNKHSKSAPPINIFIRFDTWFPWPVNILHHFILPPNPSYDSFSLTSLNKESSIISPDGLPYLFSPENPTIHAPYMSESFSSPLRIFSPSDVALGRYGTAIWIDAQSDVNTPSQAGDHGQRVAGTLLKKYPPKIAQEFLASEHNEIQYKINGMAEESDDDEDEENNENLEYSLPVRTDGGVAAYMQNESRGKIMSFKVEPITDLWSKVAMDEDEGKIALGAVDGSITIYDYCPPSQ